MNVVCVKVVIFYVMVNSVLSRSALNNTDPTRGRFF